MQGFLFDILFLLWLLTVVRSSKILSLNKKKKKKKREKVTVKNKPQKNEILPHSSQLNLQSRINWSCWNIAFKIQCL